MTQIVGAAGGDRIRVAPGHHLYPGADGVWRWSAPGDRFLRLNAPDVLLRRLQLVLDGRLALEEAMLDAHGDMTFAELVEGFQQRGLLVRPTGTEGVAGRRVHVEGDNPVARLTADLLAGHVKVSRGPVDGEGLCGVDLLVSCAGWLPDARWRRVDRWCGEHQVAWHRSHAEALTFSVGPCWVPGRTATYAETRARRLAAAGLPDELLAHWVHLDGGRDLAEVPWPSPGGVALIAGSLVGDVLAHLAGDPLPSGGHQLQIDPADGSIRRHPVLPLPRPAGRQAERAAAGEHGGGADTPDRSGRSTGLDGLVDPRLGLIRRVVRQPTALASCVGYAAHVSATDRFASWVADRVTGGAALDDEGRARAAAIGEAVERYCGNAVPDGLATASFTDLARAGRRAVDPEDVALHAASQYRRHGFPFVPLTRDLEVAWARGRDLMTGEEVLVPASLVYLNYFRGDRAAQPRTNLQAFAGIAAGRSAPHARRSALEEAIERDAATIWWLSGVSATRLDLTGTPAFARVLAEASACDWEVSCVRIPTGLDVPVVGALVEDHRRGIVAFGTACRAAAEDAAAKALSEAIATHAAAMELADPASAFWQAVGAGRAVQHPHRPYRPDRAYRDGFRRDWRDLHDLDQNLQLFLDPRMQGTALGRLRGSGEPTALASVPAVPPDRAVATYLQRLGAAGLRAVALDLTTTDVAAAGLHVARVVVPGLYSNAPAAFPLLGGRRLYEEPAAQGWVPRPLTETDLDLRPLPAA